MRISRKSRTFMFRWTVETVSLLESKTTILKYFYLHLRYNIRYDGNLCGEPHWECPSGLFAANYKEISEQLDGFGLEDTALDVDGVVEAGVGGGIVEGACVAGFRVGGGVDEA